MVWGGKSDYATWFSSDEDKIFGIQNIPLSPAIGNLKLNDKESLDKIVGYYDKILNAISTTRGTFVNYYLLFKKINGLGDFTPFDNGGEVISRTILYLLK